MLFDLPVWLYGLAILFISIIVILYVYIIGNVKRKSNINILQEKIRMEKNLKVLREERFKKKMDDYSKNLK